MALEQKRIWHIRGTEQKCGWSVYCKREGAWEETREIDRMLPGDQDEDLGLLYFGEMAIILEF